LARLFYRRDDPDELAVRLTFRGRTWRVEETMTDGKAGFENGLVASGRVEAFSDAVIAIVITLLALEIHRPEAAPGELGLKLLRAWPSYLAYALAFLYVGVIWLNHHGLFRHIRQVDLPLNWINLGILGTTALIPFPTGVLAEAFQSGDLTDQRSAVVLYAAVAGLMSAAWLPVFPYLARHPELLKSEAFASSFARQFHRPLVGVGSYALAALIAWFVHPLIAVGIFGFMVVYHAKTSEGSRIGRR
jgi:uncharacterized membrane protein